MIDLKINWLKKILSANVFAALAGNNTFSGDNSFSAPVTVATPTAGGHAVNRSAANARFSHANNEIREWPSLGAVTNGGLSNFALSIRDAASFTVGTTTPGQWTMVRFLNSPVLNSGNVPQAVAGFGWRARISIPSRDGVIARLAYGGLSGTSDTALGTLAENGISVEVENSNPHGSGARWRLIVRNAGGETVSAWSSYNVVPSNRNHYQVFVVSDASQTKLFVGGINTANWPLSTYTEVVSVSRVMTTTNSITGLSFFAHTPVAVSTSLFVIWEIFYTYNMLPPD